MVQTTTVEELPEKYRAGYVKTVLMQRRTTATFLSEATGIERTRLTKIINGKMAATRTEVEKICSALSLPIDEAFDREKDGKRYAVTPKPYVTEDGDPQWGD